MPRLRLRDAERARGAEDHLQPQEPSSSTWQGWCHDKLYGRLPRHGQQDVPGQQRQRHAVAWIDDSLGTFLCGVLDARLIIPPQYDA